MSDGRERKPIGNPWSATRDGGVVKIRRNSSWRPMYTTDYLDFAVTEADDLVEAIGVVVGGFKVMARREEQIAQWIRDHVQYHPGADGVLLEAIADGILEGLYNQASAKVAGHDYEFAMECGECELGMASYGALGSERCMRCNGTAAVRVRRRHVPSHYDKPEVARRELQEVRNQRETERVPTTTDYCRVCGESPESARHNFFGWSANSDGRSHSYVPPWAGPGVAG